MYAGWLVAFAIFIWLILDRDPNAEDKLKACEFDKQELQLTVDELYEGMDNE